MNDIKIALKEALGAYFSTAPLFCEQYGNGHINSTFLVTDKNRYILQKVNKAVFPHPDEIIRNQKGVTEHIRRKVLAEGKDASRATLTMIPTLDGKDYFIDSQNEYWRMCEFVEGSVTYERIENTEDFYRCGKAFGNFQQVLSDYPAQTLFEPIANFHNTPWRYQNLMRAVERDSAGRLSDVVSEVAFAKERKEFCHVLENAYAAGKLPLRVTHNDTKLNNILFDKKSGDPLCVIDLDTIMAGYSVNDFGDSIRFGANTAAEDETDLSKVSLDLELFEACAKGFLEGCDGALTETELELLPIGAIMMTFECGMRFLTDHLEGDVYFRIHRPGHNLDRARNQFALVADMERKLEQMRNIINRLKSK